MSPPDEYSWSLRELARYPFLDEAKGYISEEAPSLGELIKDSLWGPVRERGKDRVFEALDEGKVRIRDIRDDIEQEEELFSYPIARMLVSSIGDNFLVRRYSLGEAERVVTELSGEDDEMILKMASALEINAGMDGDLFTIFFGDYLENTERLRAPPWKLVNQDLRDGKVYMDREKFIRLLKERVFFIISEDLPAPVSDQILNNFERSIEQIEEKLRERKTEIKEIDLGKVENDLFPPCIKKLVAGQKEGENLSHEARFALTAFLRKVGLSEDDIIAIFKEAPDFDEDMASYQIEHIIGEISGTEYNPPGCDLMKTNGICYNPDSLCEQEWMNHPLSYYSFKKKKGDESGKEGDVKEENG
ncbi:MAG: DNA primase large subunit PriL [Candidatus Thermoplasmatota archaeon]|nr:DNA primase large subunit PriL [Candidatus Thermoplasmatota archaeon]